MTQEERERKDAHDSFIMAIMSFVLIICVLYAIPGCMCS